MTGSLSLTKQGGYALSGLRLGLIGATAGVAVTGAIVFGGHDASAEQTVSVDPDSLESLQADCRNDGGIGLSSAAFRLEGTPDAKPDLSVDIDIDGDGAADQSVTLASAAGSPAGTSTYTLEPRGFIAGASAVLPDEWTGSLSLTEARCDFGPPPADACEEFPGRSVFHVDGLLGDPKVGRAQIIEIPQSQIGDGIYDVTLKSFDAHSQHGGQGQQQEKWHVIFPVRLSAVETDPIDDLPDDQDVLNQKVGQIRLESDPSHIIVIHELWSASGQGERFTTPESVTAVCVALDRVGNVPAVPGGPD
jgi:hypothetical protein